MFVRYKISCKLNKINELRLLDCGGSDMVLSKLHYLPFCGKTENQS